MLQAVSRVNPHYLVPAKATLLLVTPVESIVQSLEVNRHVLHLLQHCVWIVIQSRKEGEGSKALLQLFPKYSWHIIGNG